MQEPPVNVMTATPQNAAIAPADLPLPRKFLIFGVMAFGMFMALIDIQIVAASLNEIRPGTVTRVEVLPFHQMGRDKWETLGREYELTDTPAPDVELVDRVRDQFRAKGLTVY